MAKTGRPIEWTQELVDTYALDLEKWYETSEDLLLEEWLQLKKLHRQHLVRFSEISPLFCEVLARAREKKDNDLIKLALARKIDIVTLKFYLCNRSSWKEKPEVSVTTTTNTLNIGSMLDLIDGTSKGIVQVSSPIPPKLASSGDK